MILPVDRRTDTARLTEGPSQTEPRTTSLGPRGRSVGLGHPAVQFMLVFALLALALVLLRGNLLWTSRMLNPDEAELMAEGRTASLDLFPYSGYTSSTHLFLWPFVLGVLDVVGVPMTLVTAHILSGLSYVFLSTTGWFLMMRRIGGLRAALLVLPPATLLLMGYGRLDGSIDFLSMTSESLPLVILSVAALVLLGPSRPMSTSQLIAGSMVAGLAVWAKPQSGPIAVAFIAACVLITCVENAPSADRIRLAEVSRTILRSGLVALLAFGTPTVVFLGVMALGGTLDDLVREPLAAMWNYTAHRDQSEGFVAPGFSDRLAGVGQFTLSFPFAAVWALGALLHLHLLGRLGPLWMRALGLVAILLPVAAAVLSLWPIHPLFTHYANFLYLGCLLASCVAVRLVMPGREEVRRGRPIELACVALSIAVVSTVLLVRIPITVGRLTTADDPLVASAVDPNATSLSTDCPTGSRVLVWGWAAELYATYDWTPASRFVNATWQIFPNRRQGEWSSILRDELRQDPPACIVEALGPDFFYDIDPSSTISSVVPGVSSLLESCYAESAATTVDDRPVTLYRLTGSCAAD
jgi:hypothetical protein